MGHGQVLLEETTASPKRRSAALLWSRLKRCQCLEPLDQSPASDGKALDFEDLLRCPRSAWGQYCPIRQLPRDGRFTPANGRSGDRAREKVPVNEGGRERAVLKKLGIADEVAGKTRKVRGPPSGEPVASVVARGEAEVGFQQVAEADFMSLASISSEQCRPIFNPRPSSLGRCRRVRSKPIQQLRCCVSCLPQKRPALSRRPD